MANNSAPYGLRAVRHESGGNVQPNPYSILASYGSAIFTGDPVVGISDSSNSSPHQLIQLAAAAGSNTGATILGVFAGVKYKVNLPGSVGTQIYSSYWPGTASGAYEIEAMVFDDPNIIFQVQTDGSAQSSFIAGTLYDVAVGSGNTVNGISTSLLNIANGNAQTGKAFRVLRLIDNKTTSWGPYADVEVKIVGHAIGSTSGLGGHA